MHIFSVTFFKQLLLTMTASIGFLTIGLVRGWSSSGIPSIQQTSLHLVPNGNLVSWVSSAPPLGALFGSLITAPLLQSFGRKKMLLLTAPLFSFSWVIVGCAENTSILIIGRFLTGICAGIVMPSAQVYVSECAHHEIRGILGSLPALFMAIGVLMSYIMGSWLRWDYLAFVSALFPAGLFFLLLPLPKSPAWLRSQGLNEDADESAKWLHHEIRENQDQHIDPQNIRSTEKQPRNATVENAAELTNNLSGPFDTSTLLRRPVMIPFGLVITILVFQPASGVDIILFYSISIFKASGSYVNSYVATVIVGIVLVVGTLVSVFTIDKYGRKPLLIFSGSGMAASMTCLGCYFYLDEYQYPISKGLELIPVMSLMVFMISFSQGYFNIPYLLMGELLPARQRSVLSSIASALSFCTMFTVVKSYHNMTHSIGYYGIFWVFAVISATGSIFITFLLPETKGKSLDEIEGYFLSKEEHRKHKTFERKLNAQNCLVDDTPWVVPCKVI